MAEILDRTDSVAAGEQPQDEVLSVEGRIGRYANIDLSVLVQIDEAAILGDPLLGNVHVREHLDSGDNGREHRRVVAGLLEENAVDPEANHDVLAGRLDMDVARTKPYRLLEKLVYQVNHRSSLKVAEKKLVLGKILLASQLGDSTGGPFDPTLASVELLDGCTERLFADENRLHGKSGQVRHLLLGISIERVHHAERKNVVLPGKRHDLVPSDDLPGKKLERFLSRRTAFQVDKRNSELFRQEGHQVPISQISK